MAEEVNEPGGGRATAWTLAVIANLLVPFPLGLIVTDGEGSLGMLAAIAFCWGVGFTVSLYPGRWPSVLIRGAYIVALTQVLPILQIVAGALAIGFCDWIKGGGLFRCNRLESELFGYLVTLMTALPLVLAAFVFGGGLRLLFQGLIAEEPEEEVAEENDEMEPEETPLPRFGETSGPPESPRFRPQRLPPPG